MFPILSKIFNHISETDKDDESSRFVHFCGVPNDVKGLKRRKRYDLLSAKWEKHHITWKLDKTKFSIEFIDLSFFFILL